MRYQYPFKGKFRITCPYGKVGNWAAGWHIGVDIVGDDKTVYPIAEGVVESVNNLGRAYGNHVTIRHADDNVSLYAHLSKVYVKRSQPVWLNTPVGVMGATGNANGAHLHLELHRGDYKYPRGYKPKAPYWLLDPIAWIEDHIKEDDDVSVQNLVLSVKGKPVTVKAVNVEGSNYVLLRDVPKLIPPIEVGYDAAAGRPKVE